MTSIAYFRVYWRYIEPKKEKYNWSLIDKALKTAHERHQQLWLRIAPFGSGKIGGSTDVPDWYRKMVGNSKKGLPKGWQVDENDPRYVKYFGGMIVALGKRYDGNPNLAGVDLSFSGFWGEGSGTLQLTTEVGKELIDAYTDNFKKTPLVIQTKGKELIQYALSQENIGWREDCLGDMGGFSPNFSEMLDYYPEQIIKTGLQDAWKKAPVSFESCWTMQKWKNEGWNINYIINQSLKWHISSFNAKSAAVPKAWWPEVDRWLKRMGYRFVLRRFTYPEYVGNSRKLSFTSWWENKGVAPIYSKDYRLAIRLINKRDTLVRITDADITTWMPGDNLYNSAIFLPYNMPKGKYQLQIGIVDKQTHKPNVKLAIGGRTSGGWYHLGEIEVK
jgi:hypothetical protein